LAVPLFRGYSWPSRGVRGGQGVPGAGNQPPIRLDSLPRFTTI